jgi:hypothetical protein
VAWLMVCLFAGYMYSMVKLDDFPPPPPHKNVKKTS